MKVSAVAVKATKLQTMILGICLVSTPGIDGTGVSSLWAQDYQSVPFGEEFKTDRLRNEKFRQKKDMLKGNVEYDQEFIKKYFAQYLIPRMTQLDHFEDINLVRNEIFDDLRELRGEKASPEARTHYVNEITFKYLSDLAKRSTVHPTARINAVLIVGQLDAEEGSKTKVPVPLKSATGFLLGMIKEEQTSDAILAAALVGIERHAQIAGSSWPAKSQSTVAKELVRILTSSPPGSRPDDVHSVIQRKCMSILSQLNTPENAQANAFILSTISNVNADSLLRLDCIRWMGSMESLEPTSASETATGTAEFIKKECIRWSTDLDGLLGVSGSGGGGNKMGGMGMGMGGMGGMGGPYGGATGGAGKGGSDNEKKENPKDVQSAEVKIMRRRLNQLLDRVHFGLDASLKGELNAKAKTGLLVALNGKPVRKDAEDLLKRIVALQKAVNDSSITDMASLKSKTKKSLKALIESASAFPGVDKIDGEVSEEESAAVSENTEVPNEAQPTEGDKEAPAGEAKEDPNAEPNSDGDGSGN